MTQPVAVVIAAAFALIALAPLARSHLRHSTFWMLLALGAFAFPIAQWVTRSLWDPLAVSFGVPQGGIWGVATLYVRSLVDEVFKIAPVLIVAAMGEAPQRDWYAYGAAAGAGFGLFGAQTVIAYALEAARLGLSSPASLAMALLLRFFYVLPHVATTAFVGWAAPRGWLGRALAAAAAAHLILALLERGQGTIGTVLGGVLIALVALFFFLYAWTLRDQVKAQPSRLPAR